MNAVFAQEDERAGVYAREVRLAAKTSFQSLEGRGLRLFILLRKTLRGRGASDARGKEIKVFVCQRRCEPAFGGLPTWAERFK